MKLKFLFSLIAILFVSTFATYASFPVENAKTNTTTQTTVVQNPNSSELTSPAAAGNGKSQLTAALICFFIGGIGIHRFYLGYTWQGIVQVLTLGGCGIWALIDFVRILTGDLQPKDGSYDKTL